MAFLPKKLPLERKAMCLIFFRGTEGCGLQAVLISDVVSGSRRKSYITVTGKILVFMLRNMYNVQFSILYLRVLYTLLFLVILLYTYILGREKRACL